MVDEEIVYNKIIEGIEYLAIEKYESALSCFDEALKLDDSNLAALNNKAISLNGINRYDEAISIFDEILDDNPKFIFSLIGKGESLFNLEYYDAAIMYFDRALKIDNDNDLVLLDKAEVYEKCNQFEDALNCLDKVKWISGYTFMDKTRYNRLLNKFKKETFNQRLAFINKINSCFKLNKFKEVYDITDDALEYDGNSLYFLFSKAYSAYRLNKYDESLSYLDKVLKIDFMNVDALNIKSRVFIKLNAYNFALDCLDNIKKLGEPVDSSLYKDVLAKVNSIDENKLKNVKEYIFEGNELISQGNIEGALDCYELALELDSNSIIALNNKGYAHYLLKDYTNAVYTFNLALKIDEKYVYSLLGKSYSLYYLKYYVASLNCFNKVISEDKSYFNQNFIDLLNRNINES